jgi:DNA-binding CsgD family transcriptional regulator
MLTEICCELRDPASRHEPPSGLRGRERECAVLEELVADIRQGRSRVLVLRGEAGIGKTALLQHLTAEASGLHIVRAAGVESQMKLAFANLHQLCGPMLGRLPDLPAPQRQALEVVFGLAIDAIPDEFRVGLGVLTLLSKVAEERPVLCVIDDAQWLDKASALTLAFVALRLMAEPIGVVFSSREPGDELRHLPHLDLAGLRDGDARALLASTAGFTLDERIHDRIIAEARGNPLALLELPRGSTATQLTAGLGLTEAQSLAGPIEETVVRRLSALSDDARSLLLLASAEPFGDPLLLLRASAQLGITVAAVDVETYGLLSLAERVTFRHPPVRSAVYRSATIGERRTVHLALAEATDGELDPDRRAWHLAVAAAGPDEHVASELEHSAGRAQARGGLAAAAAFLHRSVALSVNPARRVERALAAAHTSLQAGAFDAARELLAVAEVGPLDPSQLARVDLIRGQLAFAMNRRHDAPPLLLKAAKQLASLDPMLARETYLEALFAALLSGRLGQDGGLLEVARAARSAPKPPEPPRATDLLLDGYSLMIIEGYAVGAPILQQAVKAFRSEQVDPGEVLRWGFLASYAAQVLRDEESYRALPTRQIELAREAGALAVLPMSLTLRLGAHLHSGELDAAAALLDDLAAVSEATGTHLPPYGAIALACSRGREADVRELISANLGGAIERGEGMGLTFIEWTVAMLHNAQGRYGEALVGARRASERREELQSPRWLHELVEAAVRSGEHELAASALEELAGLTRVIGTAWALGIEARSRALLSENAAADRLYREAIDHLERSEARVELGRAHLLYGEWLRREGRRVDARAELRVAHDLFTATGWEAFAERARIELLATGQKVRKRILETRDELTTQERQIAQLARDRLSNSEIGSRLFLSPRTVEWHLGKVFGKLGIGSRRELVAALPITGPGAGDDQTGDWVTTSSWPPRTSPRKAPVMLSR